jgi:hypothetical protein
VTSARAEQYRRLARQCLAMARTISTEEARAELILMAQTWYRLAEEQDNEGSHIEGPSVPPAPEARPVMQQQQQVQPKRDKQG